MTCTPEEYAEYHESPESLCPSTHEEPRGFCAVCEKLRPLTLIDDGYDGISACAECEDDVRHYLALGR